MGMGGWNGNMNGVCREERNVLLHTRCANLNCVNSYNMAGNN